MPEQAALLHGIKHFGCQVAAWPGPHQRLIQPGMTGQTQGAAFQPGQGDLPGAVLDQGQADGGQALQPARVFAVRCKGLVQQAQRYRQLALAEPQQTQVVAQGGLARVGSQNRLVAGDGCVQPTLAVMRNRRVDLKLGGWGCG